MRCAGAIFTLPMFRVKPDFTQGGIQSAQLHSVFEEGSGILQACDPWVKLHRYNHKYLPMTLNGYGDNGTRIE